MADYTQPEDIDRRVRFFNEQFLIDQDLIDEQKYHIDRQRRLARHLYTPGIIAGLDVTVEDAGAGTVRVAKGTAIDSLGRQIVLAEGRTLPLTDAASTLLVIAYAEHESDEAQVGSQQSSRWHESPVITAVAPDAVATPEQVGRPYLPLAHLTMEQSGDSRVVILTEPDPSVRVSAGLRIPGPLQVSGATTLAEIAASSLTVNGPLTASVGILHGDVIVGGATSLQGDLTAYSAATLHGNLAVYSATNLHGDVALYSAATLHGALTAHGATALSSSLTVAGAASLSSSLTVGGATTLSGGLTVTGEIRTPFFRAGQGSASTLTTEGWYRIAQHPGDWANAEFSLRDRGAASGRSSLTFRIGSHMSRAGSISFTLLNHSRYSNTTFMKVRVLTPTSSGPHYLDVYVNPRRDAPVECAINDNLHHNRPHSDGWEVVSWEADSVVPPGYAISEFDIDQLFVVGDSEARFSINRGGGVGVGVATPSAGARLEVRGGLTILEQQGWQNADMSGTSWVRYSTEYNPAQYFKDSQGIVHLRGLIKSGSIGWANNVGRVFTLPEGYRPPYRQLHVVCTNDAAGRVDIDPSGRVIVCSGNNAWVSLDGISFRAS